MDLLVRCLATGSHWTWEQLLLPLVQLGGRDQEGEGRREQAGLAEISSGSPSDWGRDRI